MGIFKKFKSAKKGLRYKLLLAFSLMSVIPLLACTYIISSYLFPQVESLTSVSFVIVISIAVALLGLLFARSLINPVIDMSIEANIIANGQYDRNLSAPEDDELGNLASSINVMTRKIKTNLDEIKSYGQKMREINTDVHKKVLALSGLLQIGDVISSGSIKLDPLLEMAVEKAAMLFDSGFCMLYMAKDDESDFVSKVSFGDAPEVLKGLVLQRGGRGILEGALESRSVLVVDTGAKPSKELDKFKSEYGIKCALAVPIYSGRKNFGLLVIGNEADDCKYKVEDIDLVKVFAKQITIAIESDILTRKAEDLSLNDELTGLYNKNFILGRLAEEIKRAIFYQRPCSLILLGIDDFTSFRNAHGELAAEEALKRVAKLIKDNMIPVGKAARVSLEEFALLLPEKNKKESLYIAEEIRKKIEASNFLKSGNGALTVSGGVSENPIDGATSDELFRKAAMLLKEAHTSGKNKVIT